LHFSFAAHGVTRVEKGWFPNDLTEVDPG